MRYTQDWEPCDRAPVRGACKGRAKDDYLWDRMSFLQDDINPIQLQCVSPSFHILIVLPQRTDLTEVAYCHTAKGSYATIFAFSFRRLWCAAESFLSSVLIPLSITPTLQLSDDNLKHLTLPGMYLVSVIPCNN